MSGSIFATEISYPAIIARELGLTAGEFRYPSFPGFGGLPFNIEQYLRRLEQRYGTSLNAWEIFGAGVRLRGWMDEAENYWERGDGTRPIFPNGIYHNLASWGMTVEDAYALTAGACRKVVDKPPAKSNFLNQIPENSFHRTALRVLNPTNSIEKMGRTAVSSARELATDGGIENLIVALGANNVLGTVTSLDRIRPTDDRILSDPIGLRGAFNIWRPEHFDVAYRRLAAELKLIGAERVFLGTVPHVTIGPIARGTGGRLPGDSRYFNYYTHFWITDDDFNSDRHPHITGEEARGIDAWIDHYNQTIHTVVEEANAEGLDWHVVDLCSVLERMAFRRYREIGEVPPGGFYEFPAGWTKALRSAGIETPTTEYLTTKDRKVLKGGMFSLDGIHPSTMGYGIMAHEFIRVMQESGVAFLHPVSKTERVGPIEIDFDALMKRDTLLRVPPAMLDDVIGIMNWLDGSIGISGLLRSVHGQ